MVKLNHTQDFLKTLQFERSRQIQILQQIHRSLEHANPKSYELLSNLYQALENQQLVLQQINVKIHILEKNAPS